LRKYGLACYCCGFNFESFNGEIARDRAIVHHLETFHGKNDQKRVSTVDDVRVVCANCHYVIHFTKKPLDVDVLRSQIEQSWTRWGNQDVSRS
jgi:5-methylcytosine-specific restriction protein A